RRQRIVSESSERAWNRRLEVGRARGRRLEELVDPPRDGPGAALTRLERRRGDARRHLQRLDAVQRAMRIERTGLDAVEPGGGNAAAPHRRREGDLVEQTRMRRADDDLVRLAVTQEAIAGKAVVA